MFFFLKQDAIIRMLNFNKDDDEDQRWEGDSWKVLIYDNHCSDIIAPLLRVHQLREQGVTLHLYERIFNIFFYYFF